MLWDICFLYSLAGRDIKAKGCLLPRARVLQVTKTWPPVHAACSLLPSASLWFQEFGCEAKASQVRKMWANSQLPQEAASCVKIKRSAQPHQTHQALQRFAVIGTTCAQGWGLRRLLKQKEKGKVLHITEFPSGDVKHLELKLPRSLEGPRRTEKAAFCKAKPPIFRGLQQLKGAGGA